VHAVAVGWVIAMLALGAADPTRYEGLLQEDHFVEWWTVTLFGAAGFFALRLGWRERRLFDVLVGAFCVFVAGEEFSWGQRLLGLTPPDAFLEHNRQQEINLHNFAAAFGEPKWVLMAALLGFGLVLPAVASSVVGKRVLARAGATAPRLDTAAWLLAAVALLAWYPLPLTGEWVEALAGSLFLITYSPSTRGTRIAVGSGALLAGTLSAVSGLGLGATDAQLSCVRLETRALAEDLAYGSAATERLAGSLSVHKRVFTAVQEGYVDGKELEGYNSAACSEDPSSSARRAHALDPWGSAYWVHVLREREGIRLVVYSFGPNRRRDGSPGGGGGDDQAYAIDILLDAETSQPAGA
jgi:hypothetical protein